MPSSSSATGSSSSQPRNLNLNGHVGFDSLPDQLVNKAVRGGFTFNVMCIGETGLGKSTLMDTLFNTSFESMPADHKSLDVKLKSRTYELEESSVRLNVSDIGLFDFEYVTVLFSCVLGTNMQFIDTKQIF